MNQKKWYEQGKTGERWSEEDKCFVDEMMESIEDDGEVVKDGGHKDNEEFDELQY